MPKEPPRILAVNPGSRYIGIAAFRGPELLDWGIKIVGGKTSKEKLLAVRHILLGLIDQYCPDALAIKRLHRSRSSPRLNELARQIKTLSRRRGLKVFHYSIQDLEGALCPGGKANKRKLAAILTTMYPALTHELQRETEHRNAYHTRMFEAVALGTACYQHLENH